MAPVHVAPGPARRVLIIALNYPPMRGIGTLRPAGFVRHLPEFGWEPTVVTVNDAHLDSHRDPSLTRFIPDDVEVVRVTSPAYFLQHHLRGLRAAVRRTRESRSATSREAAGSRPSFAMRAWLPGRVFATLSDWVFMPHMFLPWSLAVIRRARPLAERADVIFSSALPMGCHLAAAHLARQVGRPWIADFRDLFSSESAGHPTRLHHNLACRLEGWIVRHADRVVTTSDGMTQRMMDLHRPADAGRIVTITNGFDRVLAAGRCPSRPADGRQVMRISHVGRIYGTESRPTFLRALRELIDTGEIPADAVQFELVGHVIPAEVRQIRDFGLEGQCVFRGLLSQHDAFGAMLDADVLLVEASGEGSAIYIRAKLFEYMLTGNPVLGITGPGPMRRVIEETRIGRCATPGNVDETKAAIRFFHELFTQGRLKAWAAQAKVEPFDRRELTHRLARELDSLVDRPAPQSARPSGSAPAARVPRQEG